jgi:hypothetical protein
MIQALYALCRHIPDHPRTFVKPDRKRLLSIAVPEYRSSMAKHTNTEAVLRLYIISLLGSVWPVVLDMWIAIMALESFFLFSEIRYLYIYSDHWLVFFLIILSSACDSCCRISHLTIGPGSMLYHIS